MINLRDFNKTYISILLTFISSIIISQTNVLMLSNLGEKYVSAYIIPTKFMIIDTIIIFALAPIVSIAISSENDLKNKNKIIKSFLSFTLFLSIILTIIGFIVYPLLIDIFVNEKIKELAKTGVFLMNISIPIRMLIFICTMILYTTNSKNKIWYIYFITVLLNIFLSWFFIYYLNFGFSGSYYSTLIIFFIEFFWLIYLLTKEVKSFPFSFFDLKIILDLIKNILAEGIRLVSWQFEGFFIIALLSSKEAWIPILGAFSIISPFLDLILMPLIALMRASSIEVAKYEKSDPSNALFLLQDILKRTVFISFLSGILLIIFSYFFSTNLYHLDSFRQNWWNYFIIVFGLSLPLFSYGYLLRSCFQACGDFSIISKIDISLTWIVFIPLLIISIINSNPLLFFSSYTLIELAKIIFLRHRLNVKKN